MKIAVLGPICKDRIRIDNKTHEKMGSPAYFIGKALQSLGLNPTLFITYSNDDDAWVKDNLKDIKIIHIPAEGTLVFNSSFTRENPDYRYVEVEYKKNTIKIEDVLEKAEYFDFIIFGTLLYENTPKELFKRLKHKKIVLGNFGMFSYPEGKRIIKKNPEKLIEIVQYLEYLFLDEEEIKFVAGKKTIEKSAGYLIQKGVKNIIVTRGSEGSIIFTKNKKLIIPAYPPEKLEDITGAGDTYLAGFIKASELFDDPEKQGKFAAMCATKKIERKGPLNKTTEEIMKVLDKEII